MRKVTQIVLAALSAAMVTVVTAQARDADSLRVVPRRSIHGHLFEGQFIDPTCAFYDRHQDEIFVCDPGAHRIAVATSAGVPTFSFGSEATLVSPNGLVVDDEGRIYVADQGHEGIRVFDYDGQPLADLDVSAVPPADKPFRPVSLALAGDGTLYAVDPSNRRVVVLPADRKQAREFRSPPARADLLMSPTDIDLTPEGDLAIVDAQGVAVQIFTPEGDYLRGWGEHDVGHHNFSLPSGIAVDEEGRVFVSDTLRQDVKVFEADGSFLLNFGGLGSGPGAVRYPVDVVSDGNGRILVVERNNFRVQIFEVSP